MTHSGGYRVERVGPGWLRLVAWELLKALAMGVAFGALLWGAYELGRRLHA